MSSDVSSLGLVSEANTHIELPVALESVQAGFPAPNGGYVDGNLDVNEFLITSPSSTYVYRVSGESMIDAGIMPGDFVLVDSSVKPNDGDIVVASVDNEFTIKELRLKPMPRLIPQNKDYPEVEISENSVVVIVGPVISVIRKYH